MTFTGVPISRTILFHSGCQAGGLRRTVLRFLRRFRRSDRETGRARPLLRCATESQNSEGPFGSVDLHRQAVLLAPPSNHFLFTCARDVVDKDNAPFGEP